MANKQSFTPEEWTKILESVALSGVAVTAADPNGLLGLFKVVRQRKRSRFGEIKSGRKRVDQIYCF